MDLSFKLEGTYRIYREDRETGITEKMVEQKNAIQTGGIDLLLDLLINASTNYYDNSNAFIQVTNGAGSFSSPGTVHFSQQGANSGYPDHSVLDQVTWRWSDISTNTYTVDTIRFARSSSADLFSETTGISSFNYGDSTSDVSKPNSENWHYEYELSGSSPDTIITSSQYEGVDFALRAMTNNLDSGNAQNFLDDLGARCEAEDSSDSSTRNWQQVGSPSRPSNTSAEWEFEDTGSTSYDIDIIRIYEAGTANHRFREDGGVTDSKDSNTDISFTYTLNVST